MKSISSAALTALEGGGAIVSAAVKVLCQPSPVLVWGGYAPITLAGEVYTGVGDRGLVTASGGALGGAEQGLSLELSGVEPKNLELLDASTVRGASVVIWRLIFDSSGSTLLDATVFARGRVDAMPIEETPGGTATIRVDVEGASRGLGRRSGRSRTDADQRLISGADNGFKAVTYAGDKTLYWGGKPPQSAGSAIPNVGGALGGMLGGQVNVARV